MYAPKFATNWLEEVRRFASSDEDTLPNLQQLQSPLPQKLRTCIARAVRDMPLATNAQASLQIVLAEEIIDLLSHSCVFYLMSDLFA